VRSDKSLSGGRITVNRCTARRRRGRPQSPNSDDSFARLQLDGAAEQALDSLASGGA